MRRRRMIRGVSPAERSVRFMNRNHLSDIAKRYLIFDDGQGETQLIRRIQQARGERACFATAEVKTCRQLECCWREDCLAASAGSADPDS